MCVCVYIYGWKSKGKQKTNDNKMTHIHMISYSDIKQGSSQCNGEYTKKAHSHLICHFHKLSKDACIEIYFNNFTKVKPFIYTKLVSHYLHSSKGNQNQDCTIIPIDLKIT